LNGQGQTGQSSSCNGYIIFGLKVQNFNTLRQKINGRSWIRSASEKPISIQWKNRGCRLC
jgi:hypothetical protein